MAKKSDIEKLAKENEKLKSELASKDEEIGKLQEFITQLEKNQPSSSIDSRQAQKLVEAFEYNVKNSIRILQVALGESNEQMLSALKLKLVKQMVA